MIDGVVGWKWSEYEHYDDCSMLWDNVNRDLIPFTTVHLSYKGKEPNTIGSFINWTEDPFTLK